MTTEQIAQLVEQAVMRERRRCASLAAESLSSAEELFDKSDCDADREYFAGAKIYVSYLAEQIKSGAMPHEAK